MLVSNDWFLLISKKLMEATMAALLPNLNFKFLPQIPSSSNSIKRVVTLKPAFCSAVQQVEKQESEVGILCEPCSGTGWLLCDFCNGQKTNVKSQTNKIYRRCPSCKATGYVLCPKCKVFKCVTFQIRVMMASNFHFKVESLMKN